MLADSDIRVHPLYLDGVTAALAEPGVGLVTCLYRGLPADGIWSRLAADAMNSHFLPNVLVGLKLGLAKPCFGSTIALRRDTLAKIGGFEAFADQLADDYAIGAAVRRLGLRVAIPPMLVSHICYEPRLSPIWSGTNCGLARTIRCIDPLGYVGLLVTNPTPFALACRGAWRQTSRSLSATSCLRLPRMAVSIQAGRLAVGRGAFWLGSVS